MYIYIYIYIYTYIHAYIHTHTYMHRHTYVAHICPYVIHTYTHTHTHIHNLLRCQQLLTPFFLVALGSIFVGISVLEYLCHITLSINIYRVMTKQTNIQSDQKNPHHAHMANIYKTIITQEKKQSHAQKSIQTTQK